MKVSPSIALEERIVLTCYIAPGIEVLETVVSQCIVKSKEDPKKPLPSIEKKSRKSWNLCSVLTRIISRKHNLNRWPNFQTKTILPVQEN
jgi:hypothetical protein